MWHFPLYTPGQSIDWALMTNQFSWLKDMQGVPQDPEWHAEGDVYIHTKMVVEALTNLPEFQNLDTQSQHILFASAMLHDVEKRSTTTQEAIDGKIRIVSPKHALKGEYTTRAMLYQSLDAPFKAREAIAKLVRLHGLPLWAIEKEDPRKAVIQASLSVNTAHLAMLAKADVIGRVCQDKEDILMRIALFEELCKDYKCYGQPRDFESTYGRFLYLNNAEVAPDYIPYDDRKFEVVVMSALPGSGKDTFIKKHYDWPVLSLDNIRRAHKISPTDKKKNGQVIQWAKEQAKVWMRTHTSFVFNATNTTRDMRARWISLFTDYGAKVKIVYLEVPYRQLLKQNHQRTHKVPERVLDKLIGQLEIPSPQEAHDIELHIDEGR